MDGREPRGSFPLPDAANFLFVAIHILGKNLQAGAHQGAVTPPVKFAGLAIAVQDDAGFRLVDEDGVRSAFKEFAILSAQQRLAPQPLAHDGGLPARQLPVQDEAGEDSEKPQDDHPWN